MSHGDVELTVEKVKTLWNKHTLWLVRDGHNNDLNEATSNNQRRRALLIAWEDIEGVDQLFEIISKQGYGSVTEVRDFTSHLYHGEQQLCIDLLSFLSTGYTMGRNKSPEKWKELYGKCVAAGSPSVFVREDYVVLAEYGLRQTNHLFVELPHDFVSVARITEIVLPFFRRVQLLDSPLTFLLSEPTV